jgi:hypothetical protein
MHTIIDAQLPQKVPKRKTYPTPRKWVINDYPLLTKCESLYSITTNDLHHQKALVPSPYCDILVPFSHLKQQ